VTATLRSGNGNSSESADLNRQKLFASTWLNSNPDLHTSLAIPLKQRGTADLIPCSI
jgi:hypothetical protein